ncbi:cytochrome P450 89A2-like [Ananas comosus]|uniref:Cytochrome P450 89A2-like n=1 Tax=Ananas comosus TaxID=4615 RepID=A0A6P5HAQ0_ANACO|nr:cytochrome P450 89A2-like [Ananas comosus]
MDSWILFLSILLALTLSILLLLTNHHKNQNQKQQQPQQQQLQDENQNQQQQQQQQQHAKQPPGPPSFLLLADVICRRRSVFDTEHLIRALHARHGPVVALRLPFQRRPSVFVADRRLAHRALVEGGAAFAHRPPLVEPNVLFTCGQRDISSSSYGPYWRLVRRNLASKILPPSRVELFAPTRRWALAVLIEKLKAQAAANDDGVVVVMESFKHAIFCLLVFMCFGVKLDDDTTIADIQAVQQFMLAAFTAFPVFAFFPTVTKLLFRKRWNACVATNQKQQEIFGALIRARQEQKLKQESDRIAVAYVDSLLELRLPEEQGRSLTDGEVVSLCSEFLSGGTDTTATALQWIMANLVRRPDIQTKLYEEIKTMVGTTERKEIDEKVLSSMPYLKTVILEGLRRHPPAHFVLPHTVTANMMLGEYCVPKGADVNFMVAEIGWEGKVWEDPMEFRPERFLEGGEGEAVDITGSREIKMMPFGAGRRMCPGYGLAMLHLEYFVSNLVWEFEWKAIEGI